MIASFEINNSMAPYPASSASSSLQKALVKAYSTMLDDMHTLHESALEQRLIAEKELVEQSLTLYNRLTGTYGKQLEQQIKKQKEAASAVMAFSSQELQTRQADMEAIQASLKARLAGSLHLEASFLDEHSAIRKEFNLQRLQDELQLSDAEHKAVDARSEREKQSIEEQKLNSEALLQTRIDNAKNFETFLAASLAKDLNLHLDAAARQKEAWEEYYSKIEHFVDQTSLNTGNLLREFITTGETDFKGFAETLKDEAVDLVAELAVAFARNRIIIPLVAQVIGAGSTSSLSGLTGGSVLGGATGGAGGLNLGGILSGGQSAYGLSGGILSGVSSYSGGLFGLPTAGGMMGTLLPGTTVSTLPAGGYAALTSQGLSTSGLGLGTALGLGALGGLGYSTLGAWAGLPQNQYSGLTSAAGGALGAWGGAALGSSMGLTGAIVGSVVPVIGTIIGAALGGLGGSLLGGSEKVPHTLSANMLLGGFSQPGSAGYDVYRDPSLWIDNPNNVTAGALGSGFEFMIAAGRYGQDFGTAAQGKELAKGLETYFDNWFDSLEDTLGDGVVNAILKADPMAFTFDDLEEGMSFEDLAKNMTDQVVKQYGGAFASALISSKLGEGEDFAQAFVLDPAALYALRHGTGTQADLEALINQYNQAAALWDQLGILKGDRQTSGFQAAIDNTNAQFDQLTKTMEALGFTAAAIADVEAERTEYLERQTAAARENFDQTLGLRQMALQGGTDVSMYLAKQSFLGGQESELLGGIQNWIGLDQGTTDQVGAYFDALTSGDRGTASGIFAELSAGFSEFGEDGDRVVQLMQLLRDEFDLYSQSLERQRAAMRALFDEDLGIRWLAATGQTGQAEKLSFLSGQKAEAIGAASSLLGADFQGLAGIEDRISNYFAAIGSGDANKAYQILGWLNDRFGELGEDGQRLTELLGVLGNEFQNYTDEVNAQIEAEKRAWEMASEDLQVRKLYAQGLDDEAAAMEYQLAQERELEQARLDGADASYLAEMATVQKAEADKYAADMAEAAAEAAKAEAQAKKEASEDLDVRLLRAQGLDMEAEAMAFAYQQQREFNAALQNHATAAELDKLATIQAAEALAFHKQQAETYTQFHTDLMVRYYQATGQAMLADLTSFSWSAYQLVEQAKGMGYDMGFVTEVLAEERLALIAGYEDEADAANTAASATSNYTSQLESARKQADQTIYSLRTNIQGWMDAFEQGNLTVLNPQQQLSEAAFDFERQYVLAKGGDQAALQSITQYADRYLQAGRSMYASSMGYQDIYSGVMELMRDLPEQVDYQALILQAIQDAGSSVTGAVYTGTGTTTSAVDNLREEFQTQFDAIDLNLSGGITPEEWQAYFTGNVAAQEQVANLLGNPKLFADGKLNDINNAFWALDLNDDQMISQNELIVGGVSSLLNPTQTTASQTSATATNTHILSSLNSQLYQLNSKNQNMSSYLYAMAHGMGYFAEGGYHSGGLRLVGETGPELEVTGPARYWTAQQTQDMLRAAYSCSDSYAASDMKQLLNHIRRAMSGTAKSEDRADKRRSQTVRLLHAVASETRKYRMQGDRAR